MPCEVFVMTFYTNVLLAGDLHHAGLDSKSWTFDSPLHHVLLSVNDSRLGKHAIRIYHNLRIYIGSIRDARS